MTYILHQQLIEIRNQAKAWLAGNCADGFDPLVGICGQAQIDRFDEAFLLDLNSAWPGGSGDKYYPVPHPNKNPANAFIHANAQEMWNPEFEYARNRLALLDWLIEQTASQAGSQP